MRKFIAKALIFFGVCCLACLFCGLRVYCAFNRPVDYFCSTEHEIYQYLAVHGQELFEELAEQIDASAQSCWAHESQDVYVRGTRKIALYHVGCSGSQRSWYPFLFIQTDEWLARTGLDGSGFLYSPYSVGDQSDLFRTTDFTYLDQNIWCVHPEIVADE